MPTRNQPGQLRVPARVVVVDDPDDAPSTQALLSGLNNIDAGVLLIRPTPGVTGPGGLGLAVLAALGKTFATLASQRATALTWRLAQAWTVGHAPDTIVVDRAHRLPDVLLTDVLALAAEAGAALWLIDAGHPGGRRCTDRLPARTRAVTLAPGQLATLRRPPPAPPGPVEFPQRLPTADFLTFRAVCARQLDARSAALVDAVYQDALTAFLALGLGKRVDDDRVAAWDLPYDLTRELACHCYRSVNAGEALVRLRGAQAGLLRAGFLLRHNIPRHAADPAARLLCPLTPQISAVLRTLLSTTNAAAAALHLLMPYDTLYRTVTYALDEIPDDASYLGVSRDRAIPVPEHARPILRAHAAWVRQQPRPADRFRQPLFGDRPIGELVSSALAHLPIAPHLRQIHRGRHFDGANASAWMDRCGLSIEPVTSHLPGQITDPWLQGARG